MNRPLRLSQIETLKAVAAKPVARITPKTLAAELGITEHAADCRLLRLVKAGALYWRAYYGSDMAGRYLSYSVYELTNKGRSELSGGGGS